MRRPDLHAQLQRDRLLQLERPGSPPACVQRVSRRQLGRSVLAAWLAVQSPEPATARSQPSQPATQPAAYDAFAGEQARFCKFQVSPSHAGKLTSTRLALCAETYERLDDGALAHWLGLPALRRDLLAHAHGDVLEVAVGTGLNLPFFTSPPVASLTALDISEGMLAQVRSVSISIHHLGVRTT